MTTAVDFCFVDPTESDEPVELERFYFTIFDVDQQRKENRHREMLCAASASTKRDAPRAYFAPRRYRRRPVRLLRARRRDVARHRGARRRLRRLARRVDDLRVDVRGLRV